MKFVDVIQLIEEKHIRPRKFYNVVHDVLLKSSNNDEFDHVDHVDNSEPNVAREMVEELHEVFDANLASR